MKILSETKDLNRVKENLKNIFESGELDEKRTIRKNRMVRTEGKRQVQREINMYTRQSMIVGMSLRAEAERKPGFDMNI